MRILMLAGALFEAGNFYWQQISSGQMQALIGEEDRLQRPVMMAGIMEEIVMIEIVTTGGIVMIEIEEGGVFLAMNHQGTEVISTPVT